jgi:hypothetical protein
MLIALTVMFKAFRGWLNEQDAEDERARQAAAYRERMLRQAAELYVRQYCLASDQVEPVLAEMRQIYEARVRREAAEKAGR